MKPIKNRTHLPIKIPLPGGKVLHLGPAKVGQIADEALEHEAVQSLVKAGTIEVLGEGAVSRGAAMGSAAPHEQTRGHHSSKPERPRGNR